MHSKKTGAFLIGVLIMVLGSGVLASPPSDIELEFDSGAKLLIVKVSHGTLNEKTHFIREITVFVGEDKIISQTLKSQPNKQGVEVSYRLPDVSAGDVIAVEARCNISGKMKKEIAVK